MCEEVSCQIIKIYFSCQWSCLLLLLEVCKNYYKKENSVSGSKQHRDVLFEFICERLGHTYLD